MEHFVVIANEGKDEGLKTTAYIENYLKAHGKTCEVRVVNPLKDGPNESRAPNPDTDCILVLGGDGTLLRAAVDTIGSGVPLLGVNLGMLGYLAEVDINNLDATLRRLIDGEYERERRMMLEGEILQEGNARTAIPALNDIVISRSGVLQIVALKVYVNGQLLNEYQADGVIISTPTGSTGYNMSAGGPIVEPSAKLIVLTPICSHMPGAKSIVLSSEDEIEVMIAPSKQRQIQEMEVSFDGSRGRKLYTGDRIRIRRSEQETEIIKMSRGSFLETLHKKMSGA